MKKIIINPLLISVMIFSLQACVKKPPPLPEKESSKIPEKAEKEKDLLRKKRAKKSAPGDNSFLPLEKVEVEELSPIISENGKGPGTKSEPTLKKEEMKITRLEDNLIFSSKKSGFQDIFFEFDKYNLKREERRKLNSYATWLRKRPAINVRIEGHCDERGTIEYNLALGEKRANTIKKYLTSLGIAPDRISTLSYGEERPLDPRHNENAWRKNRRGHLNFLP